MQGGTIFKEIRYIFGLLINTYEYSELINFCFDFTGTTILVTTWKSRSGNGYLTSTLTIWWPRKKRITGNSWTNKRALPLIQISRTLKNSSGMIHVIQGNLFLNFLNYVEILNKTEKGPSI